MKVKCEFDGKITECKVTENMGYQGGRFVKAVEYNNTERIVVKNWGVGDIWRPKEIKDKWRSVGNYVGQ